MKKITLLITAILMVSGCTTNGAYDSQKTWLLVGAVVVGGAAAANSSGGGNNGKDCFVVVDSQGSDTICR